MKEISLTRGKVALVDDADFDGVNAFKWHCNSRGYAQTSMRDASGKQHTVKMHRYILQPDSNQQVDHANHNTLDNTRANLRVCTAAQNQHNRIGPTGETCQFTGVYWKTDRRQWHARIRVNGKRIHLGYFTSEIDAARAYDAAKRTYFGEFALCNFSQPA